MDKQAVGTALGKRKVSLNELATIEAPEPLGPQHKPIAHYAIVDAIERTASYKGYSIDLERCTFALNKSGTLMAGALVLQNRYTIGGLQSQFALGILHDNAMRIALRIIAGIRVFVCENLQYSGTATILHQKHTSGFDLEDSIDRAWPKVESSIDGLVKTIDRFREVRLLDSAAKMVAYDLVTRDGLPARLLPTVDDSYFGVGRTEDTAERSLWGLSNAFTRALRETPERAKLAHTQALTRGLERYVPQA